MSARTVLVASFCIAIFAAGCGAVASDSSSSANAVDGGSGSAATSVGTKPPDGAPGVCCPASIGGCAKRGGYRADGVCTGNEICDNMCEQRIVEDEHGCSVLAYETPPVRTTYAGPESCDAPVFNGNPPSTKPPPPPTTTACAYPTPANDPSCPATYSFSYMGDPCPRIGLTCAYPGQGDQQSDGCFATAMMWCVGDGGMPGQDAGSDAGPGAWTVAQ